MFVWTFLDVYFHFLNDFVPLFAYDKFVLFFISLENINAFQFLFNFGGKACTFFIIQFLTSLLYEVVIKLTNVLFVFDLLFNIHYYIIISGLLLHKSCFLCRSVSCNRPISIQSLNPLHFLSRFLPPPRLLQLFNSFLRVE